MCKLTMWCGCEYVLTGRKKKEDGCRKEKGMTLELKIVLLDTNNALH